MPSLRPRPQNGTHGASRRGPARPGFSQRPRPGENATSIQFPSFYVFGIKRNREEPNLTTCWICFFYFNLCFLLLLFTKRILSIHNDLPRGTLLLCLNVKPKCLCSGKHPDPVHLGMAARKKKGTRPLPEAGHSRGYSQNLWPFYFTSSSPPPLCAIKETSIQTLIRWLL